MIRHWSINGRFLTQSLTGVQRYASEIVLALDAELARGHPSARDLDIELVVPPGARDIDLKAIKIVRRSPFRGHAWEQLVLPFAVKGGLLSLGNTGPVAVRRQIVCMHDINTKLYPSSYALTFRALQRVLLPILGRTARGVSTVSSYSADQLIRHGICKRGKLHVAANGHEHVRRWVPRHSTATGAVAGPRTIVMIGTPAPHKNLGLMLGLTDRLAAAGFRLVIVGEREEGVYRAAGLDPEPVGATWLGRISDEAMAALLRDSLCLAFPSFAEGFGLPPLEAMALGCPVVVADRTSLPEICGDAALYAPPDSPDAWFACFTRLVHEPNLRGDLKDRGRERSQSFSWSASARIYLEVMCAIDARRCADANNGVETAGADVVPPLAG